LTVKATQESDKTSSCGSA